MRIYWQLLGGHVHCRVFTTGSKCGDLVFSEAEWPVWKGELSKIAQLFQEKA